jgi:Putative porin
LFVLHYFCAMKTAWALLLFSIFFFAFSVKNASAQRPGIPTGGSFPQGGQSGGKVGIDDTTKQVYGPKTVSYFLEEDVFNNRKTLYNPDTNYNAFHVYTFIQKRDFQYVDLGNMGTAMRPVFYQPNENIGAQLGYDAYTPYAYAINEVRFYDTKSPFTNMYCVLGGLGQNILRFDHSQSLSPRLNLGLNAQRATTNKQFGTTGANDPQSNLAQNWSFVFHANYRTKDDKYTFLGQFNHLNHNVLEQGGVVPNKDTLTGEITYFGAFAPLAKLTQASSWERRSRLHIYHQYALAQGFQLYHVFDYYRNKNIYFDRNLDESRADRFYPNYFYSTNLTNQDVRYRLVENKAGIKGRFQEFNYRIHFRQRIYKLEGNYNVGDTAVFGSYRRNRFENFLGGWLNYYLKDSTQRVTVEAEYLLLGGDFKLKGELVSKWFSLGYSSLFNSPTLTQQTYFSNHYRWDNAFRQVNSNNIYGQLNLSFKKWKFNPRLDYHLIRNYIYYDSLAIPRQHSPAFSVLRVGSSYQWQSKRWQLWGQTYYSLVSNDNIMRIPRLFSNLRLSFDFIYAKVLFVQLGVDLHYKSSYLADGYMPLTQQFHLQNSIQAEDYLYADVFANFRINRVKLFVKMAHVNQGILAPGYFMTPLYPVNGRAFGFGVNWPLFD